MIHRGETYLILLRRGTGFEHLVAIGAHGKMIEYIHEAGREQFLVDGVCQNTMSSLCQQLAWCAHTGHLEEAERQICLHL